MSIKSKLASCLERFDGGRTFKSRFKASAREHAVRPRPGCDVFPGLTHLNVEASFLCNLKCRMCPRLAEKHTEGLMPIERYQRLESIFPYVQAVILTGYGEPLVHPHLEEFISIARARGADPRLSTNGTLLTHERSVRLLDAGMENLQFSIDAGTKPTYEAIRVGAKWEQVLENAGRFHRIRDEGGYNTGTGWVYLVMRDNYSELPAAARIAVDLGFGLFVIKFIERNQLTYEHEQVVHSPDGALLPAVKSGVEDAIAESREIGEKAGIEVRVHPFHLGFYGACLANPLASFFVDWLGNVTPCCHLPVRSELGHHPAHSLGNVDEQDLLEILASGRARQFRAEWRERRIPEVCRGCYQVMRLPDNQAYSNCGKPLQDTVGFLEGR
jgi:radical SAM protein with 4Fe4S-binding SPASM domain